MPILETERLILHEICSDDADFMLVLLNDPSFICNIGDRNVRTLEDARAYIQKWMVVSYQQNGFGIYLVLQKEDNAPVGICGLLNRDTLEDVDIGYAFLPAFWSRGYGTESALAVTEYARESIGLKRLVAITDPINLGSVRVLEKIGMRFEKMIKLAEGDIELQLYSLDFN